MKHWPKLGLTDSGFEPRYRVVTKRTREQKEVVVEVEEEEEVEE